MSSLQEAGIQSSKDGNRSAMATENLKKINDVLARDGITKYGFTGQEEVAAGGIDLIHMNGRMYDPHLGRFLSADPTIQDPSNSQSLNRYTYCLNDPLAFTDPSGFSWWHHFWEGFKDLFTLFGHTEQVVFRNPIVSQILEIAVAAASITAFGPAGAFVSAAFNGIVSYAQTGSIGAAFQTAGITLATEYAWIGVGSALASTSASLTPNEQLVESTTVHGMVGGTINAVQGGSFKNGFLAAATSQALSGEIAEIEITGQQTASVMARGLAAGVVGGTVAAATGGNFENGMMTSAFAQIFNDELHALQKGTAIIVHRDVDAPGLRNSTDPEHMHSAIELADGEIWGYYNDDRVRLDPKYANEYSKMTDEETEEMFGTKNQFDNSKILTSLNEEKQVWDIRLNPQAEDYHLITVPLFWTHHNCNDFVNAVVKNYEQLP